MLILGTVAFLAFIVLLILTVVFLFKNRKKAKKYAVWMAASFVLFIIFAIIDGSNIEAKKQSQAAQPTVAEQKTEPAVVATTGSSSITEGAAGKIDEASLKAMLNNFGVTAKWGDGKLNIVIDREIFLTKIPDLQKLGIINPDITQTYINGNRSYLAGGAALNFSIPILSYLYESSEINRLNVNIYINAPDDYGNVSKHLCASFDFSRVLTKKLIGTI